MELLSVVLKCDDENVKEKAYSYTISRTLFDFGFNNYESGVLAAPGTVVADSKVYEARKDKRVSLTVNSEIRALIPIGDDISKEVETSVNLASDRINAPITKGDELGTIVYTYQGKEIATAPLVAANDVELNLLLHIFHIIINFLTNPLVFIPAILIIIALLIARSKKRKAERRRKLHQIRQRRTAEAGNPNMYAQKRAMREAELNRQRSKGSNSRYSDDRK